MDPLQRLELVLLAGAENQGAQCLACLAPRDAMRDAAQRFTKSCANTPHMLNHLPSDRLAELAQREPDMFEAQHLIICEQCSRTRASFVRLLRLLRMLHAARVPLRIPRGLDEFYAHTTAQPRPSHLPLADSRRTLDEAMPVLRRLARAGRTREVAKANAIT